jgi:NitT/TauT family transport system permease protein
MSIYSQEHLNYLKKRKKEKRLVYLTQITIIIILFTIWEILAKLNIINTFLYSSPSKIITTILNLLHKNTLFNHISITIYEVIISFLISAFLSLILSTILWWNKFIAKVFEPFLTIINSLPKVALGPLIIIWAGASIKSIIIMSLTISLFITVINFYQAFISTNDNYIILMKSFNAKKRDIFFKVILPSNKENIISSLKINMSMNFIGVIMGELLVSKKGLGYLIMYGSQVFNITLVITAILLLGILSFLFYYLINYVEKKLSK